MDICMELPSGEKIDDIITVGEIMRLMYANQPIRLCMVLHILTQDAKKYEEKLSNTGVLPKNSVFTNHGTNYYTNYYTNDENMYFHENICYVRPARYALKFRQEMMNALCQWPEVLKKITASYIFGDNDKSLSTEVSLKLLELFRQRRASEFDLSRLMWKSEKQIKAYIRRFFSGWKVSAKRVKFIYCVLSGVNIIGFYSDHERASFAARRNDKIVQVSADGGILDMDQDEKNMLPDTGYSQTRKIFIITEGQQLRLFVQRDKACTAVLANRKEFGARAISIVINGMQRTLLSNQFLCQKLNEDPPILMHTKR